MTEQSNSSPNHDFTAEGLRPFSELLARDDAVYHGIGADIVALA